MRARERGGACCRERWRGAGRGSPAGRRRRPGASRCTWGRRGSGSWCAPSVRTTRSSGDSSTRPSGSTATPRRGPSLSPATSTRFLTSCGRWSGWGRTTSPRRPARCRCLRRRCAACAATRAARRRRRRRGTGCSARRAGGGHGSMAGNANPKVAAMLGSFCVSEEGVWVDSNALKDMGWRFSAVGARRRQRSQEGCCRGLQRQRRVSAEAFQRRGRYVAVGARAGDGAFVRHRRHTPVAAKASPGGAQRSLRPP